MMNSTLVLKHLAPKCHEAIKYDDAYFRRQTHVPVVPKELWLSVTQIK